MSSETLGYQDGTSTYEVDTVCIRVTSGEVINSDIPPVRDQQTLIWVNYNTNKWKYVWMPKVSPNDSLFAEFLGRGSEKIFGRVKHDDGTDLAPPGYILPRLVDSHRMTLVRPSTGVGGFRDVWKGRRIEVAVPVRDFDGFRDILVMVTQPTQLTQNPCSFLLIDETLVQNLNPWLKVNQTELLEDLPHLND